MYEDSYIGQPQLHTYIYRAGAMQQAGTLFPTYESSYIKICNSDTRLIGIDGAWREQTVRIAQLKKKKIQKVA